MDKFISAPLYLMPLVTKSATVGLPSVIMSTLSEKVKNESMITFVSLRKRSENFVDNSANSAGLPDTRTQMVVHKAHSKRSWQRRVSWSPKALYAA